MNVDTIQVIWSLEELDEKYLSSYTDLLIVANLSWKLLF